MALELTDTETEFLQPLALRATQWGLFDGATPTETHRGTHRGSYTLRLPDEEGYTLRLD